MKHVSLMLILDYLLCLFLAVLEPEPVIEEPIINETITIDIVEDVTNYTEPEIPIIYPISEVVVRPLTYYKDYARLSRGKYYIYISIMLLICSCRCKYIKFVTNI